MPDPLLFQSYVLLLYHNQQPKPSVMKTLSIEPFEGKYKVLVVKGSILEALKREGYPNAQITYAKGGSLGNARGSFYVKEGF